ncbi:glyoxalase-like domain-containing protein [Aspergillus pseudotamarii]|uniref:Glyoxalase-like domain-containing protein n=1 Tax=Aspergillus pseudotamarii TaxID=132259 RepID=A0A5N6SNS8_ASPPS|nr:glyoxalase-like domain-containing protein [Aspergillus pseudotamarii]KAE8136336.1 glyoxalase-like domain-containing protein [Aspergillus pseudotamarii]
MSCPNLDHIVILIPHDDLLTLSDRLQPYFVIAPGGTHADGLTSNKLILLPDGVYIEFIAFAKDADPEQRRKHRWGNLKENTIIDWALTLPSESDFAAVQQRVLDSRAGFSYQDPIPGGRKREDGVTLEWAISAARDAQGNAIIPGHLPFWCLDRTPRPLRVPYQEQLELTQHPSRVLGISSVSVSVPEAQVSDLATVYDAIYTSEGSTGLAPRNWHYEVPAGLHEGRRTISLSANKGEAAVTLTLYGEMQWEVELLPGLIVAVERV